MLRQAAKGCGQGDLPGDSRFGLAPVRYPFRTEYTERERRELERVRRHMAQGGPLDDHDLLFGLIARYTAELAKEEGLEEEQPEGDAPETEGNDEPLAANIRREVLQRDDHTCRNCGRHYGLHVHHIRFREHGGRNEMGNLLTLCHACHSLVHAGRLRITGDARSPCRTAADGTPVEPVGLQHPPPRAVSQGGVWGGSPS